MSKHKTLNIAPRVSVRGNNAPTPTRDKIEKIDNGIASAYFF